MTLRLALYMAASLPFACSAPVAAADKSLIDAAKSEGRVVWYTTQQIDPLVRPVAAAFERKYGIKVDYVRADSSEVALRILNEGNAGRMQSDVFDGTAAVATLKKREMVVKWLPDSAAGLSKEYVDPEGYWAATNLFINTAGYNTDLVPPGTEPRNWDDLLDPKWKDQIIWASTNSTSAAAGFVGLVLAELGRDKGTEYLKRLASQRVAAVKTSARQVLDQVIAGEFAIGLQIFNHAAVLSARLGAPVKWIGMNPSVMTFNVISLTKGAPHPNAGKLLVDFTLSKEGQELFRNGAVLTTHPDVLPFDASLRPDGTRFRAIRWTPEDIDENLPNWSKTFEEIFR